MFKKILIANRGEIAVRIIKACRELEITSCALYTENDRNAYHIRGADEAYLISSQSGLNPYLDKQEIINTAKKAGAEAIHPGYGFLAENHEFIELIEQAGLVFIGPSSESVKVMGSKTEARALMAAKGIPIIPGTTEPVRGYDEAVSSINTIGCPVMLKASAGGGGKGMRIVNSVDELKDNLTRAQSESEKAFGSGDVYIEKYIPDPKHIEVQIIADKHGNYRHLFERECSIQRRHQKIVEEAPSPSIDDKVRSEITATAVKVAKAAGYFNAGTIEFLLDQDGKFYFLEMNTRVQVEHPITEAITGMDIVKEQLSIAYGNKISFKQEDIGIRGHAIECRICAEDVYNDFLPSTGKIVHHRLPSGPGIRVDRGIGVLSEISVHFDSLIAKLISWGKDRPEAISRLKRALTEYQIAGVVSNIPLFSKILNHEKFVNGSYSINTLVNEIMKTGEKAGRNENLENIAALVSVLLNDQASNLTANKNDIKFSNRWIIDDE